jgi:hypothetical protein
MAWVRQLDEAPVQSTLTQADSAKDAPSSPPASPADTGGTMAGMGSCDWCATHAPITGLPTLDAVASLPALALPAFPPAFLQTPRILTVWATAQTRGPPAAA